MPPICISPRAGSDLTEIWSYIADDSTANADAFIDKLYETIQLLANQPGSGRRHEELAPGILSLPFGRYIIFYLGSQDSIENIRVLHGARDIQTIFEG